MKFAAFDVETSGNPTEFALQPWRVRQGTAWLTSLAWVWRQDGETHSHGALLVGVSPAGCRIIIKRMLTWAIETDHHLVGWNALFDIAWLYAYAEDDPTLLALLDKARFLDGMLLWKHVLCEPDYTAGVAAKKRTYGLKAAVAQFFPKHASYEADISYHGTDPEELRLLHEYNIKDNVFTLRLAVRFWKELNQAQQTAAIVEAACLKMVARANLTGMVIDGLEARHLSASLEQTAVDRLTSLAPYGITEKIVRSTKQLGAIVYDQWQLPVLAQTKTGARSTSKAVMHTLALQDPRLKQIKEYREALNNRTKFALAPLKALAYSGDGKAYPQARVFGTYSGRMTISSKQGKNKDERQLGFAQHQMKRGQMFRRIIVAPPGFTIVEFDASGQEYRWMAIASGDIVMQDLCQPGEDPHAFMGAAIDWRFSYEDVKKNAKREGSQEANVRQCGKLINLSSQYRVGYKKLRQIAEIDYGILMTLEEARQQSNVYMRTYPGVPRYWNQAAQNARALGYVETFAGRRVYLNNWTQDLAWQLEGTAINYRIQGTGADQKYLALMCVSRYINSIGARFAFDMHDGLYFYVPENKVEEAAYEIKNTLDNLPYESTWNFKPPIPLPWDCKVGPNWGDLKPFKFK